MEGGQSSGHRGQVAHRPGVEIQTVHQGSDDDDRRQRRGDSAGQFGQQQDDGHGQADQSEHQEQGGALHPLQGAVGATLLELAELGEKNDNGQAVDEAEHDRVGDQADEFAQAQHPGGDLNNAHQHDGGEEIFDAVAGDQVDHDDGQGAGRTGDHSGSTAENGSDQPDQEGGVKPHQRIDAGDEGEGDRFGDQRQGHGQSGEDVVSTAGGFANEKIKHVCPSER